MMQKEKKPEIKHVGVRVNAQRVKPRRVDALVQWLKRNGRAVTMVETDEKPLPEGLDLLIVMGGDGTLLGGARAAAGRGTLVLGVDFGGLGFLSQLRYAAAREALRRIFDSNYTVDERMALEAVVTRGKKRLPPLLAVNDVVVTKSSVRLLKLKVYINDIYFHEYPGDGLILSSATGSTAYSLSAGGPIVSPDLSVLVLTPICAHTLFARSLVISGKDTVRAVVPQAREDVLLTLDGQVEHPLRAGDVVSVRRSPRRVRFVRVEPHRFFETVRVKFKLP